MYVIWFEYSAPDTGIMVVWVVFRPSAAAWSMQVLDRYPNSPKLLHAYALYLEARPNS